MSNDVCYDGFHSGECPGCGMTVEQRDTPLLEEAALSAVSVPTPRDVDELLERLADHLDGYHGAECHCRREIDNFPRSTTPLDVRLHDAMLEVVGRDGFPYGGGEALTTFSRSVAAILAVPQPVPEEPTDE